LRALAVAALNDFAQAGSIQLRVKRTVAVFAYAGHLTPGDGETTMKRLTTKLFAGLFVLGMASASGSALAQSGYDGYQSGGDYSSSDNGTYYDYAQVVRVDPVLDSQYYSSTSSSGRRCYDRSTAGYYENDGNYRGNGAYGNGYGGNGYYGTGSDNNYSGRGQGSEAGRNVATIAGGIVGAVLGSKIGGGSGTYAATAVGSMLGGMAGRGIYEQNQRNRYVQGGNVRVCEPEPVRDGYSSSYSGNYGNASASAYDVTYEYNGRRYTRRMSYNPGDRIRVRVDVSPQ